MFRDFFSKTIPHVEGFFCEKVTHFSGTPPFTILGEYPPPPPPPPGAVTKSFVITSVLNMRSSIEISAEALEAGFHRSWPRPRPRDIMPRWLERGRKYFDFFCSNSLFSAITKHCLILCKGRQVLNWTDTACMLLIFDAYNRVHIFFTFHVLKILQMSESLQTYRVNDTLFLWQRTAGDGLLFSEQCCYFVASLIKICALSNSFQLQLTCILLKFLREDQGPNSGSRVNFSHFMIVQHFLITIRLNLPHENITQTPQNRILNMPHKSKIKTWVVKSYKFGTRFVTYKACRPDCEQITSSPARWGVDPLFGLGGQKLEKCQNFRRALCANLQSKIFHTEPHKIENLVCLVVFLC